MDYRYQWINAKHVKATTSFKEHLGPNWILLKMKLILKLGVFTKFETVWHDGSVGFPKHAETSYLTIRFYLIKKANL